MISRPSVSNSHFHRPDPIWLSVTIAVAIACPTAAQTYHFRPDRARRKLELVVKPADRVRIGAGGCVHPAGSAARAYLQGERNEEQGLIFIPGVTMSFVPVADLIGRDLVVPPDLEFPGEPKVWIDWGRFYRHPLETPVPAAAVPLPCENPNEQPHLDIRVAPGATPDRAANGSLTLVPSRYDRNLLALNPSWAGGGRPTVCAACDGFRIERRPDGTPVVPAVRAARCSLQKPSIDSGCSSRRSGCPVAPGQKRGRELSGHINWGPATFTGRLSTVRRGPVHIARDSDAEFFLEPDGGAGLIAQVPDSEYEGTIGLEFSTSQTIRWFRTAWWREFPFRNTSYEPIASFFGNLRRHPGASGPPPSLDRRPATAIGLFGIDTAHDTHPELHPVYALAIQTEAMPDREIWQVFARSWGTEGDCAGRIDQKTDLSRAALDLPAAGPGPWRTARGSFFDHGIPVEDWRVYAGAGAPTLVIELPTERRCAVVEGELMLAREETGDRTRIVEANAPVGEPVRWTTEPGGEQLCTREPWFLPVR